MAIPPPTTRFGAPRPLRPTRRFSRLAALVMATLCCATCFGCSDAPTDDDVPVAAINDYILTREDFQRRLVAETRYLDEKDVTEEYMLEFLDQVIRKELLIQEAIRLELDRDEQFLRAIERHWENTLIRDVIQRKSKDIADSTVVTTGEVRQRYDELYADAAAPPPLADVEDSIRERLRDEKMTRALDEWIEGLRQDATVDIHRDALLDQGATP